MNSNSVVRLICLMLCIGMIASLFYFGSQPVAVGLFRAPMDKVAHFVTFALITVLLWVALFRGRPLLLVALVSCIGVADEVHQIFLPGRAAGLDDLATDILAAMVTVLLLVWAGARLDPTADR
jgi:VanZ family protein